MILGLWSLAPGHCRLGKGSLFEHEDGVTAIPSVYSRVAPCWTGGRMRWGVRQSITLPGRPFTDGDAGTTTGDGGNIDTDAYACVESDYGIRNADDSFTGSDTYTRGDVKAVCNCACGSIFDAHPFPDRVRVGNRAAQRDGTDPYGL
jgi:hypothetical protein